MLCPTCQIKARKFGRDRNGNQRWHTVPSATGHSSAGHHDRWTRGVFIPIVP
jgi:hypothetical protein